MADVTSFLEEAGVDFDVLEHAHTERAADEASALGIGPEEVAKTLVLVAPSGNVRAVLAASERIDLHKVAAVLGVGGKKVHLASEDDLARDSVVLEAGTHERSVRLKAADLVRLARAEVADICREEPTAG